MLLQLVVMGVPRLRENEMRTMLLSESSTQINGVSSLAWLNQRRDSVSGTRTFVEARRQAAMSFCKESHPQEMFEEEESRKGYNCPLGPKKTAA